METIDKNNELLTISSIPTVKTGINYIKNEGYYLIFTGIFPILIAIIQILNIFFIFGTKPLPIPFPDRPPHPPLFDVLLPPLVLIIFALVGFTKFIFLMKWRSNLNKIEDELPILTKIFYEIIVYMNRAKWLFAAENVIFVFYSQWMFHYFLNDLLLNRLPPGPPIIQLLNLFAQIGLIFYLIFEWRHFLKWNKKLNELKLYEKKIFEELEL
ncbi:MAG: hypothetical protein ACFFFH_11150 [Candidatus Thorarchaeota archaeon]